MDSIRNALTQIKDWLAWLPAPAVALIIVALALALALAPHKTARKLLRQALAERHPYAFSVFTQMRGVTRFGLLILALIIAVPVAPFDPDTAHWLTQLVLIAIVALIGWAAITALKIAADVYLRRFRLGTEDNLLARKHVTQVRVLLRAIDVLVMIVTIGAALMTFEPVRQYGPDVGDVFVERTHKSYFSRVGGSFMAVLFGLVMLVGSCVLLFWNESRAVQTARSLAEGRSLVIDIESGRVDSANEGKLVHLNGDVTAVAHLRDPEFGVAATGLRLVRSVEMYR